MKSDTNQVTYLGWLLSFCPVLLCDFLTTLFLTVKQCIYSFVAAAAKHNNEKRLLLNDPDVTGRRLADLESTQQELTRLIHRFNTNILTLQAENKNLQAKNTAFEAKHSDLQI
jgi:hypothetical protein